MKSQENWKSSGAPLPKEECLGFSCRFTARMTHTNRDDCTSIFTLAYMKYSCVNCEALRLRKSACPLAYIQIICEIDTPESLETIKRVNP